jgi:hypothetical protein
VSTARPTTPQDTKKEVQADRPDSVIVATGLIALTDDCIKERWEPKKFHRINLPLTSRPIDFEYVGPKAYLQQMFSRRNSAETPLPSPLRYAEPAISAY